VTGPPTGGQPPLLIPHPARKDEVQATLWQRLGAMVFTAPTQGVEVLCGWALFVWGVSLACGGVYGTAAVWRVIAQYVPERPLGCLLLATGLAQLYGALTPKASFHTRAHAAVLFVNALAWLFFTAMFLVTQPSALGGRNTSVFLLGQLWVYWRAGHVARPGAGR
jgi:hypothetical protein